MSEDDKLKESNIAENQETNQLDKEPEAFTSQMNEKPTETLTVKKSSYNKMVKGMIVAIAVATFFAGYSIGTLDDDSDSELTADQLKEILSELNTNQPQQAAPQPTQQSPRPSATPVIRVSLDDDPLLGNPDAPVTIVEFSDFQCPFCSRFYQQTLPLIKENYIDTGKANLVYRDFPIDSIHPNARPAHIAAECADEQGKFWEYHDLLFDRQSEWQGLFGGAVEERFTQYASALGIQTESFSSCMSSDEMAQEVNQDFLQGAQYGATGTPTFFIGNVDDGFIKLVGAQPYAAFQAAIESQLG